MLTALGGAPPFRRRRGVFLVQVLLMLPFVLLFAAMRPLNLAGVKPKAEGGADLEAAAGATAPSLLTDVRTLFRTPLFVMSTASYALYTWVLGVLSVQGPKAGYTIFCHRPPYSPEHPLAPETADVAFGIITIVTGVLSSVGGGYIVDRLGAKPGETAWFCAASLVGYAAAVLPTFLVARSFYTGFIPAMAVAELFLFANQAPVNALILASVPLRLRSLSMAVCVVCIHLCGDVPGPFVTGALEDHLEARYPGNEDTWRWTMAINTGMLVPSVLGFAYAGHYARKHGLGKGSRGPGRDSDADEGSSEATPLVS